MSKLYLIVGLFCVVYAQDRTRCPTRLQLLNDGCSIGCIIITRASYPCPICQEGCSNSTDECSPDETVRRCNDNSICLARGVAGRYVCIERVRDGESCDVESATGTLAVSLLNRVNAHARVNQAVDTVVPCMGGLVCRRRSLDSRICQPEQNDSACVTARQRDEMIQCDENGHYMPLQCRKRPNSGLYQCQCVQPRTGTPIPNTEYAATSLRETPDCMDTVFERCQYRSTLGSLYNVRSGQKFIEPVNCSRCLCHDGEATLCASLPRGSCSRLNPTPVRNRSCTIRGRTIPNGQSLMVDCNRCACKNGYLACTRRACAEVGDSQNQDPEEDRNCRSCASMRLEPVCGDDGLTYPSRCFAMNCRRLNASQFRNGSCSRRDVCADIPCESGMACVKNGGVTCLSREGCRPHRRRRCIDLANITCQMREAPSDNDDNGDNDNTNDDDTNDDENVICGKDKRSYASLCNLLQDSPQTKVAYAGSCNRSECTGGQVCGTDGVTYDNICELRNSANVRADYRGACKEDVANGTVKEKCVQLRKSRRCAEIPAACTVRVIPEDGCCPICGGALTIGLDRDAMDEYIRLNPEMDTVDEFLKELVNSGFIPMDVLERCMVSASLLETGDLNMVMESMDNSNENTCSMFAETVADRINNPQESSATMVQTAPNPQILQLVTVAETSPLITVGSLTDGAVPVVRVEAALILIPFMTLFI